MFHFPRVLPVLFVVTALASGPISVHAVNGGSSPSQWKVSSVKVCKDARGNVDPHVEVYGSFPVYSFFVPRPVWTLNGIVIEAQPIYDRGRLIAFRLLGAAPVLRSGTKNTLKLSLPDQNTSKVFRYDSMVFGAGECYEFF